MIHDTILKGIKYIVKCTLLLIIIGTSTLLWGQSELDSSINYDNRTPYSSKVFSEIDYLMNLAQKNLKKYLKTLKKVEIAALKEQEATIDAITNVNQLNFQVAPRKNDTLSRDEKDVIILPQITQPVTEEVLEKPKKIFSLPLEVDETLHREEVSLISVNVYTEKNKQEIHKYLTAKLESTYFTNYPRFSFYKNETFFSYRYQELEDSYVFSYGPQENAEVTEVIKERGGKHYARAYFFRLSDRSILDINIYDAETHEIVWAKRHSMYVSFKESNLSYRFLLGLSVGETTEVRLTNFLGIRLPVIGIYGIFFSLGTVAVDPDGAAFYFQYGIVDALLVVITIGPQISYSINELFGFSYHCCEFFLDFQFGYNNRIVITASPGYLEREQSVQQTFTASVGLSMSIRKFMFYFNFDPLNTAFGGGAGFSF